MDTNENADAMKAIEEEGGDDGPPASSSALMGLFAPPIPKSTDEINAGDGDGGNDDVLIGAVPATSSSGRTFDDSFQLTPSNSKDDDDVDNEGHRHEEKTPQRRNEELLERGRLFSHAEDDHAATHDADGPGSLSHFMGLFAPKAPAPVTPQSQLPPLSSSSSIPRPNPVSARQSTLPRSNRRSSNSEVTPLLEDEPVSNFDDSFRRQDHSRDDSLSSWFGDMFSPTLSFEETPKTSVGGRKKIHDTSNNGGGGLIVPLPNITATGRRQSHSRIPSALPAIDESFQSQQDEQLGTSLQDGSTTNNFEETSTTVTDKVKSIAKDWMSPNTYIGSFMFLFYHVVFCLAMGAAIRRPNRLEESILGVMTKTAALGIITSSAVYLLPLSNDLPALYPTVDLFLAPLLAGVAVIVDQTLAEDTSISEKDNDIIFLTTFGLLAAVGIIWSGTLLTLAGVFKLANLGSFLPFNVISGFFSAVGILTWTLSVNIDCGKGIGKILFSGDKELLKYFFVHHTPSFVVAGIMKYLGPKNPMFVVFVVIATIALVHCILLISGVSLEEAKDMGWFWGKDELVYKNSGDLVGFNAWSPPAPFGLLNEIAHGHVHWGAFAKGLSTSIAMGFLYMIRCTVHGTALKKNVPNLARTVRSDDPSAQEPIVASPQLPSKFVVPSKYRTFSEAVDIEAVMQLPTNQSNNNDEADGSAKPTFTVIAAKPTNISLQKIIQQYAYSQFVSAGVGGFAITPSVAASPTMFLLGAEKVAPQIGAVLLLLGFYLTDFQLVSVLPKPAFSSTLVLTFIDMTHTWCYKSYLRTKEKVEWLVVPAIVVCAFALDLLTAVFLGIAFSTFIFVAAFFRSGVVKFASNGTIMQSTIERPFRSAAWLSQNGHFIQAIVLQNYLFFGNATSIYNYISRFFECSPEDVDAASRVPKFVILDLSLVTGMDTSTVGIFSDIKNLCASRKCKLFLAGMSQNLRAILALGGVKPDGGIRSQRQLRFFSSLDNALGKAEDLLLDLEFPGKDISIVGPRHRLLSGDDPIGFRAALRQIDEQHGDNFSNALLGLHEHTNVVELQPHESLYNDGESSDLERGLFFIETGVIKIERDAGQTLTRGSVGSLDLNRFGSGGSITQVDSVTQLSALIEAQTAAEKDTQSFRLARIGPGWVAGTLEAVSGLRRPGEYVAVTHCRLHHLPYSKVEDIEKENPQLILDLYKLLSYLMARRQERTIGQLATLHSIMTSPAHIHAKSR